jgi:hypothetical protein
MARGAVGAYPSLAKEKGRYLIILPGMLSFKKLPQQSSIETTGTNKDSNEDDNGNDNNEEDPETNPSNDKKSVPQSLGKMVDLSTEHPSLRVPFPSGKTLVFPGKKVETTSKYILLSCSMRKKGSVTCKVRKQGNVARGTFICHPFCNICAHSLTHLHYVLSFVECLLVGHCLWNAHLGTGG